MSNPEFSLVVEPRPQV